MFRSRRLSEIAGHVRSGSTTPSSNEQVVKPLSGAREKTRFGDVRTRVRGVASKAASHVRLVVSKKQVRKIGAL